MTDPSDKSAEQHTARLKRNAGIDGDDATITFSPEVLKGLKELTEALRGKDKFDGDMWHLLKDMASGKPVPVRSGFSDLLSLGRDVQAYVEATGDQKAEQAMSLFYDRLTYPKPDAEPPVMVHFARAKQQAAQ